MSDPELQKLLARFEVLEAKLATLEKRGRSGGAGRLTLAAGVVTLLASFVLTAQTPIRPDPAAQPLPPPQRNTAEQQAQAQGRTLTTPVVIVDGSGQRVASFLSQNGFRGLVLADPSGKPAMVFSAEQDGRGVDILDQKGAVVAHLGP